MSICANCNKDMPKEAKFCPHCGSQVGLNLDGVLLSKIFGEVEYRGRVHNQAQKRLWKMGRDLGFFSTIEYCVPDLTEKGRRSYIDVVWKSKRGIEFAFEIRTKVNDLDRITTRKDTKKLQNLLAQKKFVVNVSELTGKAYFCQISDKEAPTSPNLSQAGVSPPKKLQHKAYSVAEIRQKYPMAYAKWTPAEDLKLVSLYNQGLSISQLAKQLQRKEGAIYSRIKKLGLEDRKHRIFTL